MFDFLTLSVVIDDRIFCVHGGTCIYFHTRGRSDGSDVLGLSPSIHSVDQIKVVDRFRGGPLLFVVSRLRHRTAWLGK